MKSAIIILSIVIICSCTDYQKSSQKFIDSYNDQYVKLNHRYAEAEWKTNTEIREGDTLNAYHFKKAGDALAAFAGSVENIDSAKYFLKQKEELTELQTKQLQVILYNAANYPQTVSSLVSEKIKADIVQSDKLKGYTYTIEGKTVTLSEIASILSQEKDLQKRLIAWNAGREIGRELKTGIVNLRKLRNETVQALDYPDYFTYKASDYELSATELIELLRNLNNELRPLYRELHTYVRYELAKKYGVKDVPEYIPAHWLPNRLGADWSKVIDVKGFNVDSALAKKTAEWVIKEGEKLYISLGFPELPASFWTLSNLYPYPADSSVKKELRGSAWHMDLNHDVRILMSVEPNSNSFQVSNHELGHIYYYLMYTNPDVPPILRDGANRAFHEAIGSLIGMAAMQRPYLIERGLISKQAKSDSIQILLSEALKYVVAIPFTAGTVSEFEKAFYSDNLSENELNKKWWDLTKKYQGIVPPTERGEEYCDATALPHVNIDPSKQYEYAFSNLLLFQFHQYISENILKQDPRATNYFGNKEIGEFLKKIMASGATKNWREVLREATKEDMNAKAMVRYFEPLMAWLKEKNRGRTYTLSDQIRFTQQIN